MHCQLIVKHSHTDEKGFTMSSKLEAVIQSVGRLIIQKQYWLSPKGVYKWTPWLSYANPIGSSFLIGDPVYQ